MSWCFGDIKGGAYCWMYMSSRPPLRDFSGINVSDTQATTICSMHIDMLMESHDFRTWIVSSTYVQLVSALSKLRMLLVATLLGQLNSPIKASPSTSPSLVLVRKILSIDFLLVPKSRRGLATRCSKARSYEVLKTQLSKTPMLMILGKPLSHGAFNMWTRNRKIAMNARWNKLPMAIYPDLILTSIAMMITLVSMERPHGSLSPITSRG